MFKALAVIAAISLAAYVAILSPITRRASRFVRLPVSTNPRFSFSFGLILTSIITGVFSFITFNHSFPLTEGWYTVFSKYIASGHQAYRDFELLFTPGYTYLISAITRIFGYNILVLRVFGALLFISLAIITYLALSRIFPPWISTVAASTAVLYLQSEAAQVFYDYIRVYDFLNLLVCLFLVTGVQRQLAERKSEQPGKKTWRTYIYTALTGLAAGCAIQVRQNSGYLVLAFCTIFFLVLLIINREKIRSYLHIPVFLLAAALPSLVVFIALSMNGMFDAYLHMTTSDAIASKGGLAVVLFAWIPRTIETILKEWKTCAALLAMLIGNFFLYIKAKHKSHISASNENIWLVGFSATSVIFIIIMFFKKSVAVLMTIQFSNLVSPYSLFAVGLFILIFTVLLVFIRNRKLSDESRNFYISIIAVSGLYIATAYGSATSGGLSEGQSTLIVALLIALLLHSSNHMYFREVTSVVLALSLCLGMTAVAKKYEVPYGWWGLAEPDIRIATEIADVPLLEGILVSEEKKEVLETVYHDIITNTTEEDSIFVYPHIPIFYAMTERYPETFTIVQWFDVSSDKNILNDIEILKATPPKLVVLCDLPDATISAHENLFRDDQISAQHMMLNELHTLTSSNRYEMISTFDLGGEYYLSVYILRN